MKGSLTQRKNGYWYIYLHPREAGGGWRTKCISTGVYSQPGSKKAPPAAEEAYRRAIAQYELGGHRSQPRSGDAITVATWMGHWLGERQARGLDASTMKQYESVVRLYITGTDKEPILGSMRLSAVTETVVRTWLRRLLETPNARSHENKTLSVSTVRLAYSLFRSALELAIPEHLLKNPFARVPKPKAREFQAAWLEPEQAAALLQAAAGTRLEALWVLQLATGMRIGELLALTWADVDLVAGTVRVRDAKTSAGERLLSIADEDGAGPVLEALKAHRLRRAEQRLGSGTAARAKDLVFATSSGRAVSRSNLLRRDWVREDKVPRRVDRSALDVRRSLVDGEEIVEYLVPVGAWARLLHDAGLPWMRPHDLRHTAGTLALARGVPLPAVRQMLGHRSEAFMLRRYAHALRGDRELVGAAMAGLVRDLAAPAKGPSADRPQIRGIRRVRASARTEP